MDAIGSALVIGGIFIGGAVLTDNSEKVVEYITSIANAPNTIPIGILLGVLLTLHSNLDSPNAKNVIKVFSILIIMSFIYQNKALIEKKDANTK